MIPWNTSRIRLLSVICYASASRSRRRAQEVVQRAPGLSGHAYAMNRGGSDGQALLYPSQITATNSSIPEE